MRSETDVTQRIEVKGGGRRLASSRRVRRGTERAPDTSFAEKDAAEADGDKKGSPRLFLVKNKGHLGLLSVDDIDWLRAEGNYTRIRVGRVEHLVRRGIGAMEAELSGGPFLRINRSMMVNMDRVSRLDPSSGGGYMVRLSSGGHFKLTRRFARKLFLRFGKPL
jgi:DNA-binding LytR/AlgR family response regulator